MDLRVSSWGAAFVRFGCDAGQAAAQAVDRGWPLPGLLEGIPVRTVYSSAERAYRPDTTYEGEIVLFRATSGEGNDEPFASRYTDPLLGWGQRGTRGVRVFDVPGGHSSMLQEPHVQVLADLMQRQIDAVLVGHAPVRPVPKPDLPAAVLERRVLDRSVGRL